MKELSIIAASLMAGPGVENGFTRALKKVFTGGYWTIHPGHPKFGPELLHMAKDLKPDVIFIQTQTSGILDPEIAGQIAEHAWTMQFSGDIRNAMETFYAEIGRKIHLTTFSNMRDVRTCLQLGIVAERLECGVDPEIYKPYPEQVQYDVIAHLNDYGDLFPLGEKRREIVQVLQNEFGDRFCLAGNFPGAKHNFNGSQIAEARNYSRGKIAINISNILAESYSSDRLGRILLSGIMCLSHVFPGIEQMYKPGTHLITFDSVEDMLLKIKGHLFHDELRRSIVEAGRERALEIHTFNHMANEIKRFYDESKTIIP